MVTIKVTCTEAVGNAIMQLFAAIETIGGVNADGSPKYKSEELQFEMGPAEAFAERGPGPAKSYYIAKLPRGADGSFDMARVEGVVRANLESLGAETIGGIIYQDIVKATLAGEQITERQIRDERHLKAGTCQGRIQQMRQNGIVESLPIIHGA